MTTMDDNAFRHCEQLVRAADKDRFLSALFAPADRRGPLFALYAFNVEVARVAAIVHEPMAGEIRLQWWRDVLNGERDGEAAASPVAAALRDTIAKFSLPITPLLNLLEARAFDLYDDPTPSLDALEAYVEATSSTLVALAATVLAGNHPAVTPAARPAGLAYGMAGLLRTGRTLGFADLATRAGEQLGEFEAMLFALPAAAAPAFLPTSLVRGDLRGTVPQWRRQWTLWRAARRYARDMKG